MTATTTAVEKPPGQLPYIDLYSRIQEDKDALER
jgi:hypothetical protein